MNKKWVWKHDLGEHENVKAHFQDIEDYQGERQEQQQKEQVETQPTKKRTRSEGTSQQGTQAFDSEPP